MGILPHRTVEAKRAVAFTGGRICALPHNLCSRDRFRLVQVPPIANVFAKNDGESDVREAAVKRLEDQSLLADIAKSDKEYIVRVRAVQRLEDQLVIAHIANK